MGKKAIQAGEQTREVPSLDIRAAFQPSSINDETRTIDVVWTTGEKVLRSSFWDGDFFEELSLDPKHVRMARLTSGRSPFLADHNGRSIKAVIGVVESATLQSARIRFAKDDPEADAAWNKVRQGILPNVSVGYRVHKMEKVEDGEAKVPTFRATDWEPYEVSLVPMGADSAAHVRAAPELNSCTFITRGSPQSESKHMDEIEKAAEAKRVAEATRAAEIKTAADAAVKADRERQSGIRAAVRGVKLEDSLADKMIADGLSLADARTLVIDELAKRSDAMPTDNTVRATVTDDKSDKFNRGVSAWLYEKAGAERVGMAKERGIRGFKELEMDGGEFRGASLVDLARRYLELRGVRVPGYDKVKIFETAFNHRASGYSSTSDFSVLFENVMYKMMLAAYATEDDVWSKFCGTKEVQDFKPANFFRTGSFGVLAPLNENGEFQNKAIPDGLKASISVGTFGGMIALSRQAVINDDMGALSGIASQLGADSRRTIEDKVFTQLLLNGGLGPTFNGQYFFHSQNANLNTVATANTAAGWDADALIMGAQRDLSDNHYLNLVPTVLLVPRAKLTEAKLINTAAFAPVDNKFQMPNTARDMAKEIVSSQRLSGTRRYWFANPAQNPAIVVAFLAGQGQGPVMSSAEGWRTDGTEWKVRMDFGVNFFDPKTALTSVGA